MRNEGEMGVGIRMTRKKKLIENLIAACFILLQEIKRVVSFRKLLVWRNFYFDIFHEKSVSKQISYYSLPPFRGRVLYLGVFFRFLIKIVWKFLKKTSTTQIQAAAYKRRKTVILTNRVKFERMSSQFWRKCQVKFEENVKSSLKKMSSQDSSESQTTSKILKKLDQDSLDCR